MNTKRAENLLASITLAMQSKSTGRAIFVCHSHMDIYVMIYMLNNNNKEVPENLRNPSTVSFVFWPNHPLGFHTVLASPQLPRRVNTTTVLLQLRYYSLRNDRLGTINISYLSSVLSQTYRIRWVVPRQLIFPAVRDHARISSMNRRLNASTSARPRASSPFDLLEDYVRDFNI